MISAKVIRTVDVKYKNGQIKCECGWTHDLGDGFNVYYIASCPACDKSITTRVQNKVSYWEHARQRIRTDIGDNRYFVMSNGINVRYYVGKITTYSRR